MSQRDYGLEPDEELIEACANSRAQLRWMRTTTPRVLYSSALGKGKTWGVVHKADNKCRCFGGTKALIGRRTLASLWKTTLAAYEQEIVARDPALRRGWSPGAYGGPTQRYPNGSEILFAGLDDPQRAQSGEWSDAYIDQGEELDKEEADAIAGRLRLRCVPWRQIGFICNPAGRTHHLFKEFRPDKGSRVLRAERDIVLKSGITVPRGTALREVIVSGALDNIGNMPVDYQLYLASLKGRYRMRMVDGLWVSFEGAVYDQWDDDVHLVDVPDEWLPWRRFPPPDWPRYRAIDFGYEPNPFVCQWWARRPRTMQFWRYREIYFHRRTVPEHGRRIKELERAELEALREATLEQFWTAEYEKELRRLAPYVADGLEMSASVADHDADGRAQLDRMGVWTDLAEKDVGNGIQTVYGLMGVDAAGESGLKFVRGALDERDTLLLEGAREKPTCTEEEIPAYAWKKERDGSVTKDEPVKVDDHGCDAMRYLFHTLSMRGELVPDMDED